MEDLFMPNILDFEYHLCAVIFGADETILNLKLDNGFSFVRRSLMPLKDHLDQVFDMSAMGLRRAYETARIDKETLDVICIEKHILKRLERKSADEYYDEQVDNDLISLDNQIRAIRLVIECPLRCKSVSFRMRSEKFGIITMGFNSIVPISESATTKEMTRFHCESEDIQPLRQKLRYINFPIKNILLNTAHRYYDLSYHQENHISITLLIVALEMIFLSSEVAKKEKLSKRCAVFMYDKKGDRVSCYKQMVAAYKQRSDFVHDGVFTGIDDKTILFLRQCVRNALLNIDALSFNKKRFIKELVKKVQQADSWE